MMHPYYYDRRAGIGSFLCRFHANKKDIDKKSRTLVGERPFLGGE
jgi:hypothetical protein